jgi:outer membrane receptor protein involved in Fe transport
MKVYLLLTLLATAVLASDGRAEEPPLPLDVLLATPISTASKYEQQLSSVAASATVITAEDIERYGWTTMDEVLRMVRGFYVSYDRNYSYVGVRGISQLRDYNSRILIMVDDQPTNGPVYGDAYSGTALALDLSSVERIEIVRGPGSAMFGSHAMLAVINIITKGADGMDGMAASLLAGSAGKKGATFRMGQRLSNGYAFTVAAYAEEVQGEDIYLRDFDAPETNDGVASGLDYHRFHNLTATLKKGNFRLGVSTRSRLKGIPTAAFGVEFNEPAWTRDSASMAALQYTKMLGVGKQLAVRGGWQHLKYEGRYPYTAGLGLDHDRSTNLGGDVRFRWELNAHHQLTIGTEVNAGQRAEYEYTLGDHVESAFSGPFDTLSHYIQDEYQFSDKIAVTGGLRYDSYSNFRGALTPRAGLILTPSPRTTVKILYGSAFKTPSLEELENEYDDPNAPWYKNPDLKAESVRTVEVALEQRISPVLFGTASLYNIKADNVVQEGVDSYQNLGRIVSRGAEAGLELRRANGLWAHLGYALQTGNEDGQPLVNAPRHMLYAGVSTSPWRAAHGGLEAMYESARTTRDGNQTDSYVLLNGTASRRLAPRLRLSLSVQNILDQQYALPVGPEIVPEALQQDGRTWTLKVSYQR